MCVYPIFFMSPLPSLPSLSQPSTISFGSVGRVTFTLKKAKGGVKWPKLLDSEQKKPGQRRHLICDQHGAGGSRGSGGAGAEEGVFKEAECTR